jgi:IgA Peptidase M64
MGTSDGRVLGATQVFGAAAPSGAFNIALLADGFRDLDQGAFNAVVDQFVQSFMTTPPFDRYTHCINVFRVNVASIDAGADDPATGAVARTYFDSTFGTGGLSRLLTCNTATALLVAAQEVPEFTVCLVAVNSTTYGGSGGSVGTFSLADGALEIAIHELGHTAFGLADEYDFWAGGDEPNQAQHPPGEPSQPNVTLNTDRATLKWTWAVEAGTRLPTTSNPNCALPDTQDNPFPVDTVGCYEGAHYFHCGAYRPQHTCKMRSLGVPFCRVCEAAIGRRLDLYSAVS